MRCHFKDAVRVAAIHIPTTPQTTPRSPMRPPLPTTSELTPWKSAPILCGLRAQSTQSRFIFIVVETHRSRCLLSKYSASGSGQCAAFLNGAAFVVATVWLDTSALASAWCSRLRRHRLPEECRYECSGRKCRIVVPKLSPYHAE